MTSQRTGALGYQPDTVRQRFTGYEKDQESDLEFAQARHYSSKHGRFTSPDTLLSSGDIYDPESWNRYIYSFNNPIRFNDPTGLYVWSASLGGPASDEELLKRKVVKQLKIEEINSEMLWLKLLKQQVVISYLVKNKQRF